MFTVDKQDKFVELRAQGWSFAHIASELHLSKRTLVDWSREFAADIESFRTAGRELLHEKVTASREEDLNRLLRFQKDVEDELAERSLSCIPIEKLIHLASELRKQVNQALAERDAPEQRETPDADAANPSHDDAAGTANCRPRSRTPRSVHRTNGIATARGSNPEVAEPEAAPEQPDPDRKTPDFSLSPQGGDVFGVAQASPPASSNGVPPLDEALNSGRGRPENPQAGTPALQATLDSMNPGLTTPIIPLVSPGARPSSVAATFDVPQAGNNHDALGGLGVAATVDGRAPGEPPSQDPQEFCLGCGAELPALLPNGQQPSHYCQCGQSLSLAGLNLRERCSQCGFLLPPHGYNADRPSDTCPACAANLPPLDPKTPACWIPKHMRTTLPLP